MFYLSMASKKTNIRLRYDKHRYPYIDALKNQPYDKSGIGYITKKITDRNENIDSYFLRDIPGPNKGRKMLEKMLYGINEGLKKSPSTSSVGSDDSFDEIIRKLSGKKLIYEDDEPSPTKRVKRINKVQEYLNKKFTESEQRKIDKYLNKPLSKSEQIKIDKYLNINTHEKAKKNVNIALTKEQERKADEYLRSYLTKEEKEKIGKYL